MLVLGMTAKIICGRKSEKRNQEVLGASTITSTINCRVVRSPKQGLVVHKDKCEIYSVSWKREGRPKGVRLLYFKHLYLTLSP